jgi:Polysaccharide lyase
MKKIILVIVLGTVISSCDKKKVFDGPNYYTDGFENYSTKDDLFIDDNVLWSFNQLTNSANKITVDSSFAHSGTKSLLFDAKKSEENALSKCSISKQYMAFWEGETMRSSAWYYIDGTQTLQWLFLMDLEEQAAIGAGPGMRLALVDNQLRVEHKFNEKDIIQSSDIAQEFPRNQWVHVVFEIKLSQKHKGTVKVWQNGQLVISAEKRRTLPKDLLYFQQGTKGSYNSCEVGITANSYNSDLRMWVDDVVFEKVD